MTKATLPPGASPLRIWEFRYPKGDPFISGKPKMYKVVLVDLFGIRLPSKLLQLLVPQVVFQLQVGVGHRKKDDGHSSFSLGSLKTPKLHWLASLSAKGFNLHRFSPSFIYRSPYRDRMSHPISQARQPITRNSNSECQSWDFHWCHITKCVLPWCLKKRGTVTPWI